MVEVISLGGVFDGTLLVMTKYFVDTIFCVSLMEECVTRMGSGLQIKWPAGFE